MLGWSTFRNNAARSLFFRGLDDAPFGGCFELDSEVAREGVVEGIDPT